MAFKLFHLLVFAYLHEYICCLETSHKEEFRVRDSNSSGSYHSLPDLGSLCPYNKFCQSSPLKNISRTDLEPCCEKCSCDYDCYKIGSCCPDMPLAGIVKPKYPCVRLLDLAKNGNLSRGKDVSLSYHVITDCSNMLQSLTSPKCYQPTEVQDFVIVSDPKSGRVYRNRHCAECNGIQNYQRWNLRVTCSRMSPLMHFESFEEREKYLLENCTLFPFPPNKYAGAISYCIPESEKITKCNFTRQWDIYDKEIEDACMENRDDQNAFFIEDVTWGGSIVYGSVFCYLCNVPNSLVKNDACKVRDRTTEKSGTVSFVAILDSETVNDETEVKEDSHCKLPELWDPFMELCRPLLCPSGKIPVYGRCKSTFSNFEGYAVDVHFEVVFLVGNRSVNRDILLIFENRFFRKLGNDLECGKCRSEMMTPKTSTSALFLRIGVFSTEDCPSEILLERIRNLALLKSIYLKIKYQGQLFQIELKLTFPEGLNIDEFEIPVYTNHRYCFIKKTIDSSIFQYCPRIALTKGEAYNLGISNVSGSSIADSTQANDAEHELNEVCVDNYFHAARKARSGAASTYQCDVEYTSCNDTWLTMLVIVIVTLSVKMINLDG